MNITVTYKTAENKESIVQIDRGQELCAGLLVLQETGHVPLGSKPDFFRSGSLGKVVSAHCTFEELGIYSGDILRPVE